MYYVDQTKVDQTKVFIYGLHYIKPDKSIIHQLITLSGFQFRERIGCCLSTRASEKQSAWSVTLDGTYLDSSAKLTKSYFSKFSLFKDFFVL